MDLTSIKHPTELQLDLAFRNLILTKKFPITLVKSPNYDFCNLMKNVVVDIIESQGFEKEL